MAVAFSSYTADGAATTAATTCSPGVPSGLAVGDLLIAWGICGTARTIAPPSGWTQVDTRNDAAGNRSYLWSKVATSTETGGATTWTASGGFNGLSVAVLRITGGTATGLLDATANAAANDNNAACPSVTTAAAGCLILSLAAASPGNTSTCAAAAAKLFDFAGNATGLSLMGYSDPQAAAGATTARTIITSGYTHWQAATLAVAPATVSFTGGALSNTSSTATNETLAWTASSNGSGTVTAQLQRSAHSANTFSNVSGATTSPATDTGLTTGTTYDYRVQYTDSTAAVVFSNILAVTPSAIGAGVASLVYSGPAVISLNATAPSAPNGAVTYQWQRSLSGANSYTNVSGATTLALTDATVTAGVLYDYRLAQTDATPTTVNTNVLTAQPYSGGAVGGGAAVPFLRSMQGGYSN